MIKIPAQHYIGLRKQDESKLPLAFATPYEDNAAFRKRKETVDRWSEGYHKVKKIAAQTVDNVLMEGFRIAEDIRRIYWGGGNVVWRVEDPRGFELEIPSSNLARILDCTTVINGVIQGKCIWGRDGAQNLLLPEKSEPYTEATANTARSKLSVSTKSISSGDTVTVKDGSELVYLGMFNIVTSSSKREYVNGTYSYHSSYYDVYRFDIIKRRAIFYDPKYKTMNARADTDNVAAISKKAETFNQDHWLKQIHQHIKTGKWNATGVDSPLFVTSDPITAKELSLEWAPDSFYQLSDKSYYHHKLNYVDTKKGNLQFTNYGDSKGVWVPFDTSCVDLAKKEFVLTPHRGYFHNEITSYLSEHKDDLWFKLVVRYKDKLYDAWI